MDTMTVTNVQRMLNSLGASLVVDGMFGNKTREAILQFQRENNLLPTGLLNNDLVNDLKKVISKNAETPQEKSFIDRIKSFYSYNNLPMVVLSSVVILGIGYMIITNRLKQKA